MRQNLRVWLCLLWTVVAFSVTPAGFGVGGSGGGSCQVCASYSYYGIGGAFCATPQDGDWGNTDCRIQCVNDGSSGACQCTERGDGCLYIVVNG